MIEGISSIISTISALEFLILSPLVLLIILCVLPWNSPYIKVIGLYGFCFIFIYNLVLVGGLDFCFQGFQYSSCRDIISSFNLNYVIGVDGISIVLLLLTSFLMPLCLLVSWFSVTYRVKEFILLLCFIEFCLFNVFCVLDVLLFYIFFEGILIPMYILIVVWGSRARKIRASLYFFFYTLLTSFFMLIGVGILYYEVGSTSLYFLYSAELEPWVENVVWFLFFIAFASKVPMYPLHIWLPEAHVEAPTSGSILLAGVLLKMGVYGMLRFLLPILYSGTIFWCYFGLCLSLIGIVYGGLITIRQVDLKKIIAYSSVCHMNVVMLGIFSNNLVGFEGCVFLMLCHGFVSSALFGIIGLVYERYHTRVIFYYGGLVFTMPYFAIFFLLFTLCNISFPGSGNFIGEFIIFFGILHEDFFIAFIGALGIIFAGVYGMWLYNRMMFGLERSYFFYKCDLIRRELIFLIILLVPSVYYGIFPKIIHTYLYVANIMLIQLV